MKTTTKSPETISRRLDHRLLRPGQAAYEEARTIWNSMVDHRPAAILPCHDAADVRAAICLARESGLDRAYLYRLLKKYRLRT